MPEGVVVVTRNVWQGLLDWWNTPNAVAAEAPAKVDADSARGRHGRGQGRDPRRAELEHSLAQSHPSSSSGASDASGGWTQKDLTSRDWESEDLKSREMRREKPRETSREKSREKPREWVHASVAADHDRRAVEAPRLVDVSGPAQKPETHGAMTDPAEVDDAAGDSDLMEFLAADFEPVEADPEFKRKLRDELWALVQRDEMPRQ